LSARLSDATLSRLPADVARPAYDRRATRVGVVHFGPGAFHRAHQAFYIDRMLARDGALAISAVSLHSSGVRDALEPQDGLYTLVERETARRVRVIGSIRELLVAPKTPERVLARLADPGVRIVTATVTEKGYCLTRTGDLDVGHPDVQADLAGGTPRSFPGWLAAGLRRRREAGAGGLAALSCDNLSDNGGKLRRAVLQFAEAAGDAALRDWIAHEVRFPATMVDSITPATDASLRGEVRDLLGLEDAWPVQREAFVQWVVEDELGEVAGTFAEAGVSLTGDVAAFERAKLRLLNGAHSTLAYVGLRLGHETVAEAMADASLAAFVERMMRQDVAPTLGAAQGLDPSAYIAEVLRRFRNPAIVHRLSQIAWDGSQKLPFRLLQTIGEALVAGRSVDRLVVGVAAWMVFVRQRARAGEPITDPLAERLLALGHACTGEAAADVGRFLALREVFPAALAAEPRFRGPLEDAYRRLCGPTPADALAA
jgi:fructuronate reductase